MILAWRRMKKNVRYATRGLGAAAALLWVSVFAAELGFTAKLGIIVKAGFAAELAFRPEQICDSLGVGYATSLVDMNDDSRLDIVVVDTDRVIWFENPTWQEHALIHGQTKPHNVCLAPYDIDGDGKLDFALGADWRPFDTKTGGTIQWLSPGANPMDRWQVHPIGEEPTVHRMRWVDLEGDGKKELVVVPLMGRLATKPLWNENATRVLAYSIPADPRRDPWPVKVLNEDLHVTHNFWPTDLNGDGQSEILMVSYEGVSLLERESDGTWRRSLIGAGNQETSPDRGASEIKHGELADGQDYLATIEPWHGFQVVAYTPPNEPSGGPRPLWKRHMIDDQLKWGHAVWCVDLDGDADQELVIGVRDDRDADVRCGLRIYDPVSLASGEWKRTLVDPGGVAVEDLACGDLDGDGRVDIVTVGRHTKNARIYWNETPRP